MSGVREASRKELGLREMAETSPERRLMLYGDPNSPSTASCFNRFRFRERGRKLVDDTDLSGSVDGWEKKNKEKKIQIEAVEMVTAGQIMSTK